MAPDHWGDDHRRGGRAPHRHDRGDPSDVSGAPVEGYPGALRDDERGGGDGE